MLQMELVDSAFFALPYGLLRQFKTCTVYIYINIPPLGSHQQLSNKLTHIQKTHKSRLGHCSHPLPTEQAPGPANQGISMVKMLPMCWLCIYKSI